MELILSVGRRTPSPMVIPEVGKGAVYWQYMYILTGQRRELHPAHRAPCALLRPSVLLLNLALLPDPTSTRPCAGPTGGVHRRIGTPVSARSAGPASLPPARGCGRRHAAGSASAADLILNRRPCTILCSCLSLTGGGAPSWSAHCSCCGATPRGDRRPISPSAKSFRCPFTPFTVTDAWPPAASSHPCSVAGAHARLQLPPLPITAPSPPARCCAPARTDAR